MHVVVFAAGLDWLEGLLPVLFVLFWLVSQVVNVVRNVAGRGQPRPRPQPGEPVRPPRPDRERVEEVRADLERQIEEFLTQKAERRGEPAPAPVRIPPRPQATPVRDKTERLRSEKPRIERLRTEKTGPTAAPARGSRAESVIADVVKKSQPPAPQLGSLGSHGGDIARHVRDAFADDLEHRPSRLAKPMAAAAEPAAARPAVAASDLVTLLRDPAALRQLFIVREVLDRPVDRWS